MDNGGASAVKPPTRETITDDLPLVYAIAKRYRGRAEFEDLVQIGSLGLLKAARGFDPGRGVCFSTYAVPFIAGEIKRFLRDDGALKVSRRIKENAAKLRAAREEASTALGREPTFGELRELCGLEPEDIIEAYGAAEPIRSIDEPPQDGEPPLKETIGDGCGFESAAVDMLFIKEQLGKLEPRDRELILLRYFRLETQAETARKLGMTQVQVSRREKRILKAMRDAALP